jgi:hypothetical protein
MPRSEHTQAIILSIVAIVVILVAQFLSWYWEDRINPGMILALTLVVIMLLSTLRKQNKNK